MERYVPEGELCETAHNRLMTASAAGLERARASGEILEGMCVRCDAAHDLHIRMPAMDGIIPREEGALGIREGETRDIALLSRVGKPVCFVVTEIGTDADGRPVALLSRRQAQQRAKENYFDKLTVGDILPVRVTRLESFGAFCDVACGLAALLPIAGMSVSRIAHPRDRAAVFDRLFTVVSARENGRICLSMRELLGTWEQNAALFSVGETVEGIVRSVEEYGVFVELMPNLAGLAEPDETACAGDAVTVFIKSISPEKMKLKLVIVDNQKLPPKPEPPHYFMTAGHLRSWTYSPGGCTRFVGTTFE